MYRWNERGPVFEFPTPYGLENRFLLLRGRALLLLALVVVAVGVYGHKFLPEAPPPQFGESWYRAPRWPHLLSGFLLALLGGLDLYLQRIQRLLQLAPGQPASLTGEVPREATGSSAGARALMQLMAAGAPQAEASGLDARWQRWLGGLGGVSSVLQRYLRARGLLALLVVGLAFVLVLGMLAFDARASRGAIALLLMLVACITLGRHVIKPERPTPTPVGVGLLLAGALVGAVLAGLAGTRVSSLQTIDTLGLPLGALVLFGGVLAAEAIAMRVANAHARPAAQVSAARHDVAREWVGDMRRFMADVDRQLFRRWIEGIPNRRYTWLPPRFEPPGGALTAQVLEESQPAPLPASGAGSQAEPVPGQGLLYLLYALALLLPVAGALVWLGSAALHYFDPLALWDLQSVGLAGLLAGAYAARLAHTLCSRTEVQSTLTWLELEGEYRCPPADPRERTPTGAPVLPPVTVDRLNLRACVCQVRSAFYAEAAGALGSRVLLRLVDDAPLARSWGQLAGDGARGGAEPAAAAPAPAAARARRPRSTSDPQPARRPPRFCSACGTPVLSGARFCQHCGNVLTPD